MIDTQEEKIKKIFKSKGFKIEDIISVITPHARQNYYNWVKKEPLDDDFVEKIKSAFKIDLIYELDKWDNPKPSNPLIPTTKLVYDLRELVKILTEERDALKDKLLLQHEKYQALFDKYEVVKEELDKLKNRTGTN